MARRRGEGEGSLESTEGLGEVRVNLEEAGFVSRLVFSPFFAQRGVRRRVISGSGTKASGDGGRVEQIAQLLDMDAELLAESRVFLFPEDLPLSS